MSVDVFLKFPEIVGESADSKHKGAIDVLSWSWGMSNAGTAHVGGGAGAGKVAVQDITVTKFTDRSSPDLLLACCNGKHFGEATLTVRKAGEKPLEYLVVKFYDIIISSFSAGGSGGEDRLTENVSFNFAKVAVTYTEQTATGGAGAKPEMGWDIAGNAKL